MIFVMNSLFSTKNDIVIDEVIARSAVLKREIESEIYSHRPKTNIRSSPLWSIFNEIFDDENQLVRNFVYCRKCGVIKYLKNASTTTQLLRHRCVIDIMPSFSVESIKIDQSAFDELKKAAAKFVCLDLRPFHSVECPGFLELVMAGVKLGQKYPQMTKDDLVKNFPGRKAIKDMVTADALDSKESMKRLLRKAIDQGGLGCTIDLWSDKYKHNTYMAMTANFCYALDEKIDQKRLVFYMGQITDIVKTKAVIKSRIVDVFSDFGITEEEIRTCVVFTTDR